MAGSQLQGKGKDTRASQNPNICELRLSLKMETVRIGTQGSGGGGVGGGFVSEHISQSTTKHFLPTPSAWGSKLKRKKSKRRMIFQPAGGGGHSAPHLALSPHPTRGVSRSLWGMLQRSSEGDRTCGERQGIKQEEPKLGKHPTTSTGPVRRLTDLALGVESNPLLHLVPETPLPAGPALPKHQNIRTKVGDGV